jgi:hypothetical protein
MTFVSFTHFAIAFTLKFIDNSINLCNNKNMVALPDVTNHLGNSSQKRRTSPFDLFG